MSARALSSVTISFGLVSIPVKLYTANQPSAGISFNLVHKKCGSRLKQQYVCPTDQNAVVGREDTAKAYEFAKGQYVLFTEEELKVLEEQSSETIEITEFVPQAEVDPVYFEKAYWLGPDKGGEKAYRLIGAAMQKTGLCALAKYAARGKQYLVLLRPVEKGLVLQQLRYADEVRPFSDVEVPDAEVKEPELNLAVQLVEQIKAERFRPERYEDGVKKRVLELIEKKVQGAQITAAPATAPSGGQIIDLMEALKASLAGKPEPGAEAAAPAPAAADAAGEAAEPPAQRKPPKAKPPKRAKAEEADDKAKSRKVS